MTARQFEFTPDESKLPYWARSSNPIVRLHLGLYWRTLPPRLHPILVMAVGWFVLILSSAVLPSILNFSLPIVILSIVAMPLIVLSILVIPAAILLYAHVLLTIAADAARHMQSELQNKTLPLLRATPMSLEQIFLGKVAAALWRRMDDIMLTLQLAALLGMPAIILTYTETFTFDETPLITPVLIVLAYTASLIRIILEPIMVGLIAVVVGAAVPYRTAAMTASISLSAFYFLFMYLARQLPGILDHFAGLFIMDVVLPIGLPLLMIALCLYAARTLVTADWL